MCGTWKKSDDTTERYSSSEAVERERVSIKFGGCVRGKESR
jgi:hypothetical protein